MNSISFPRAPSHFQQKTVQVRLRGGQSLDGAIHIPDGLPLLSFLGGKLHFLNLTSVRRTAAPADEPPLEHLSVRLSNLVWIIPTDVTLHVSTAVSPTLAGRPVELQLVDDLTLRVSLEVAEEQRMSDYLDGNPGFLPLWGAQVLSASQTIERLAVNQEAILAIREVSPLEGSD